MPSWRYSRMHRRNKCNPSDSWRNLSNCKKGNFMAHSGNFSCNCGIYKLYLPCREFFKDRIYAISAILRRTHFRGCIYGNRLCNKPRHKKSKSHIRCRLRSHHNFLQILYRLSRRCCFRHTYNESFCMVFCFTKEAVICKDKTKEQS